MGPDMLIMPRSYRARDGFARPICDLAFPVGSGNPPTGPEGRSVQTWLKPSRTENRLNPPPKSIGLFALSPPYLRWCLSGSNLPSFRQHALNALHCRCAKNVNNNVRKP